MTAEHAKNTLNNQSLPASSPPIDYSRLQTILASSPAVIYTCRPDGDFGATFISANIKEQLGYEISDFLEESSFWISKVHHEDLAGILNNLSKLFQTGKHVHEYRFLHKNGTYRWMRDQLRLRKAQDGTPIEIVGSWLDISDRKGMEVSLRDSQTRLEEAQRISHLGSWDWDIHNDIAFCSDEIYRIFGRGPKTFNFSYDSFLSTVHQEDRDLVKEAVQRALRGDHYALDYRIVRPDKTIRYVHSQGQMFLGEGGDPDRLVGTVLDITDRKLIELDLKEKDARLTYLAYYDSLTSLPNRNLFKDRLNRAVLRAERNGNHVALLFLDLDLFKKVNDTLGHQIGDQLLQKVAKRLESRLRTVDTIARLGGDEFVVLAEYDTEIKHVARLAQRIINCLEPPFTIGAHLCYVSASIGISLYTSSRHDDVESLQKRADIAMYAAKERGRNNFQFYSQEMDNRAHELLLLENDLRQALQNGQFILHYQPKIDLSSGRIVGMEALLRWQHPDKGIIPPNDFIPLAEDTGLIVPIGKWVLRTACAYAQTLMEAGIPPLRMSVNISMPQFKEREFPALVSQILNETGLEPQLLELELTESIAMENASDTIPRLATLKEMGVCLAIDDFGTGYSSLDHLKHLPVTTLKIDRGFVKDILIDQRDLAIVKTILALAKSLGLDVVAEGIETQEQKQLLCQIGCTMGQGFLFSRPLPPDKVLSLCRLEKPYDQKNDAELLHCLTP